MGEGGDYCGVAAHWKSYPKRKTCDRCERDEC
nr:MAG TPA: hypothetical protein [Caudoviricetes sp.]